MNKSIEYCYNDGDLEKYCGKYRIRVFFVCLYENNIGFVVIYEVV